MVTEILSCNTEFSHTLSRFARRIVFFFQAEDGIRDGRVNGVQTCALPIYPAKRDMVKHEAGHCPGGRLVAWDKSPRQPYEPEFEPSLGLVEDPQLGVSGPIWVRGGIRVESADGTPYEIRNRVALCRCGGSANKPFCDGTHASIHCSDEP